MNHERILCDICGRTLRLRQQSVGVHFCGSCERFACEVCWVATAETCRQCLLGGRGYVAAGRLRPAIAETISAPPAAPPRRPPERGPTSIPMPAGPARPRYRRLGMRGLWSVLLLGAGLITALAVVLDPFSLFAGTGPGQASLPPSQVTQSLAPTAAIAPSAPVVHVVAAGDTLRSIAARYLGDEALWERIYDANRGVIADPERLVVGERLTIPTP